ncbi:GIY-YIG nuclease family protein [Candidatus Nomurabacteria bacterium]|nr:GIY-YIG nuclease family protein [Candidatus Nomurabacteria bacterium]
MHYVYVLYSHKLQKRCIDYTGNLKERFMQHQSGKVPFSKKGRPWRLVYYQAFNNSVDAKIEEKFLKSGKGRERLGYILKNSI